MLTNQDPNLQQYLAAVAYVAGPDGTDLGTKVGNPLVGNYEVPTLWSTENILLVRSFLHRELHLPLQAPVASLLSTYLQVLS